VATGDVFAVKLHVTYAGQECRPGFYLVEGTGGAFLNPCESAASAVRVALGGGALNGFSAAAVLHAVEAQDVQPGTNQSFVSNITPGIAGDVADDNPLPPQDSMLIRWGTALKTGKGVFAARSRTFMPGIYGTGQVSGFLIADLQDALSAFASLLFDPFVTDGTSYAMTAIAFNPGSPRTIKAFNLINSFSIDNVVDIQRRRRPGRGI
jgi:hypothetical protein